MTPIRCPANNSGAARVLHLDKNGKFIHQWFGNNAGQGHFSMVHGIAINPNNGNVYIGDREEYRIVVYDAERQVRQNDSNEKPRVRYRF